MRSSVLCFVIASAVAYACGSSDSSSNAQPGLDGGDDATHPGDDDGGPNDGGGDGPVDLPPSPYAVDLGYGGVYGVAVDPSGNTLVAAALGSSSPFDQIAFMAKLDPTRKELWKKQFGTGNSNEYNIAYAVTTDAAGDMVFAGYVTGAQDFGDGNPKGGSFVVRYTSAGAVSFVNSYPNTASINAVKIAPNGHVYLAGELKGTVDFGGGPLTSTSWSTFYAHLDETGKYVDAKKFGGGNVYCYSIALDAAGNILLAGMYDGSADFGGGALPGPIFEGGNEDGFVAKLDANGGYVKALRVPGAYLGGAVFDAAGNVYFAGGFEKTTDFGGGQITSKGGFDALVAKVNPSLGFLWAKTYGDSLNQSINGIALDTGGNVVVSGAVSGNVDFGGGAVDAGSAFSGNAFVLRLDPSGKTLTSKIASGSSSGARSIAAPSRSEVVIGGLYHSSFALGPANFTNDAAGNDDAFVVRFTP